MKTILLIETSDIGAAYTARAVRKLGFKPLFLCDLNSVQGDTFSQLQQEFELGNVICTKTTSVESMIAALRTHDINLSDIAGVTTFLDSRLNLAIELGKKIGTPYNLDKSILNLKNKSFVLDLIPEFSPPSLTFSKASVPLNQIHDLVNSFGKVIVKPTKLAGAIGAQTFQMESYQEIPDFVAGQKLPEHLDEDQWLCQAFVNGKLYSAEGFVHNGEIHHLGISNRTKIAFTESQLEFPANQELNDSETNMYKAGIRGLVERAKFENGFFHVEFIAVDGRSFIIDANMGRLGGGPLGEMIPTAYNLDISDFYAFVIEIGLQLPEKFYKSGIFGSLMKTPAGESKGICYGTPIAGYLNSVLKESSCSLYHTQVLNNLQNVEAMGANNWSWIGIACGPKKEFEAEISKIKLILDNRSIDLCY